MNDLDQFWVSFVVGFSWVMTFLGVWLGAIAGKFVVPRQNRNG